MLKFFEMHGRFPILNNLELKQLMINCATYLEFSDEHVPTTDYDWNTRSQERFKQEMGGAAKADEKCNRNRDLLFVNKNRAGISQLAQEKLKNIAIYCKLSLQQLCI